jgi:hypothetical protein
MMSIYQLLMATLFFVAAAVAIPARAWQSITYIAVFAISYFVSSWWWRAGYPSGELITGICDAAVCATIIYLMRKMWEVWLLVVAVLQLGVSLLYLTANLSGHWIEHEAYSILLEALNVVAIFTISGAASFELSHRTSSFPFRPVRSLFGLVLPAAR